MNEAYTTEMVQFRRRIHKRPEEGWTEFETMNIVVNRLRELGFKVVMGTKAVNPNFVMGRNPELVAKAMQRAKDHGVSQAFLDETEGYTGCVGIWETGRPGPVTLFRHDMDCVLVQESHDAQHESVAGGYCSERDGLMHACGHDGHTSVGLGVAHWIADHKDELCGTIKLLFQPAEEGTRGGLPMSESGLLDDVNYIICCHIGTNCKLGEIGICHKGFLATAKMDLTFTGTPAHAGSDPEKGRSALLAACNVATTLAGIPRNGQGDTRISIGKLSAGEGRNVVPVHAQMQIEVRGQTEAINQYMVDNVERIVKGVSEAYGVDYTIEKVGAATNLETSPEVSDTLEEIAKTIPFVKRLVPSDGISGSEDCTWLIRKVLSHGGKAGFFIFGCNQTGHHKGTFEIQDEQSLPEAFEMLTRFLLIKNKVA